MKPRNQTLDSLRFFLLLTAFLALAAFRAAASIAIDQVSFHGAPNDINCGASGEGAYNDYGGVILVFVRNTGATTESLTAGNPAGRSHIGNLTINGTASSAVTGATYTRPWPFSVGPGQVSTFVVKAAPTSGSGPVREGQSVTIVVTADSGQTASYGPVTLATPKLRIGSVVPGPDLGGGSTNLYIYVRNTDTVNPYTINTVYVDTNVTSQCTFIGGQTVAASSVNIIKVTYPDASSLPLGRPLAIRLVLSSGTPVGAYVRVTEPVFQTGDGTSGGTLVYTNSNCQEARGDFNHEVMFPGYLYYDIQLPGPPVWQGGAAYHARYSIKGMGQPKSGGLPNYTTIASYAKAPNLAAYGLSSEPGETPAAILQFSVGCSTNDPVRPTWINLNKWRSFQQYAFAVDYVCFDHYCQVATVEYGINGSTRIGISNSFYMADFLKRSCEPLKCSAFAQGVSSQWSGRQPTDWGIKVQFWNQIMGGARSILWFGAMDQSTRPTATAQYQAIKDTLKQFSLVRNLVLYSDTVPGTVTKSGSTDNIISRMLVGENAVVVITAHNSSTAVEGNSTITWGGDYTGRSITFTVPAWVNIQQVREVTAAGLQSVSYTPGGQQIQITGINYNTTTPCHIYLIGPNDASAPLAPRNLNSPEWSGGTDVLTWADNFDDSGVKGYKVYRNGTEIADVSTPLYKDTSGDSNATYTVKAYDAAGNLGAASNPYRQTKPAWTFNNPGDFCGWSEIFGIQQPPTVSGGSLNYTLLSSSASPNLMSPEMRVNAAKCNKLRIKFFNNTTASRLIIRWNTTGYLAGDALYENMEHWMPFDFPANSRGTWVTMDCDLSSWYVWSQTVAPVRLIRLDLPDISSGGQPGETIQIQSIQFLATQDISFNNPADQTYGVSPVTLSATASSGLPVSFTVTSGPATVNGSLLTITGAGAVTVRADQTGDSIYDPASLSQSFTVFPASTTNRVWASTSLSQLGDLVTISASPGAVLPATGTPTGSVQFKTNGVPAGSAVALVGGVATFSTAGLAGGNNTITAEFPGDGNFVGSTNSTAVLVNRPPLAPTLNYTRAQGTSLKIRKTDITSAISDPDPGDAASYNALAGTGTQGATVSEDSSRIYYEPAPGNNNADMLQYRVTDTRGGAVNGNIQITVVTEGGQSQAVVISSNSATVVFAGIPGVQYVVQRSVDLASWRNICTTNAPPHGLWSVMDTFSDLGGPPGSAYYRLQAP